MGFSLVTKLMGEAVNDFLPTSGYQQLYFHTDRAVEITITQGLSYFGGSLADAKPYYLRGNAYFVGTGGTNLGKEVIYDGNDRVLFEKIHLEPGDAMLEIPNLAISSRTLDKFIVTYTYIDDVDVMNFDTAIIPVLYPNPNYGYNTFTLYCDYLNGKLSDIIPAPIDNNMGFVNFRVSPKHQSPNFVGDLSEITFSNDKQAWPYNIAFINLPNITGNLNAFFDRLAVAIARTLQGETATTKTVTFAVQNCPGVFYNGESTGAGFTGKVITFNQDGTWNE